MAPNYPEADMMAVSKSSRAHRKPIEPLAGLNFMDEDLEKIDILYFNCQEHRDYYRDTYNKLQRPAAFRTNKGKCGIKEDYTISLLLQPVKWITERQPVIYPDELTREIGYDARFNMVGRFNRFTSTVFKR